MEKQQTPTNEVDDILRAISQNPNYPPPDIIDQALIEQIQVHGNSLRQKNIAVTGAALFACVLIGVLSIHSTLMSMVALTLALILGAAYLLGVFRSRAVQHAYQQRKYDLALRLSRSAEAWNGILYPITMKPLNDCQKTQFYILLHEGRAVEMEIMSRYLWAATEAFPLGERPKHSIIGNNYAIALMLRCKYAESARLFAGYYSQAVPPGTRLMFLNNMAVCYISSGKWELAKNSLEQAYRLVDRNKPSLELSRLKLLDSYIEFEHEQYEEAEASLVEAQKCPENPQDFIANCVIILARIKVKQNHLEEAELYFKNCIDILAIAENPNYTNLARTLHLYAQVLVQQGKVEQAKAAYDRAQRYYQYYFDRETLAVMNLKKRLSDPRRIMASNELLTLTQRDKLLMEQ